MLKDVRQPAGFLTTQCAESLMSRVKCTAVHRTTVMKPPVFRFLGPPIPRSSGPTVLRTSSDCHCKLPELVLLLRLSLIDLLKIRRPQIFFA